MGDSGNNKVIDHSDTDIFRGFQSANKACTQCPYKFIKGRTLTSYHVGRDNAVPTKITKFPKYSIVSNLGFG